MLKKKILSLNITLGSYPDIIDQLVELALKKIPSFICFVNVHMSIEAYNDKQLNELINQATMLTADGVPVAKSIQLLHKIQQDRVSGMDCFPQLLHKAEEKKIPVFLFGSTEDVLHLITERMKSDYPAIDLRGSFSPPFGKPINNPEYVEIINQSGAAMVFVALGCPKQERWMAENYKGINAVLLGVGGTFPVFANVQKRAPEWMQKYSFEWLYRFIQEPGRLWKRYFYTNSLFLVLIFKQWLKGSKN